MAHNLLAVNIGNTRTHLGTFVGGNLEEVSDIDNDKGADRLDEAIIRAYGPLAETDPCYVLLASVNPRIEDTIAEAIGRHVPHEILRVEKDVVAPVGRQLDREALVGVDRLLNAAGAFDVLKQACVVVDAGTAVTIDLVDGGGTFHGGAIAPGAQLMLDSLHSRANHLPEVTFAKPDEAIGHNTSQAMLTAVFHGIRGMVRELVEQYAESLGSYPMVVATGGDAAELFVGYGLVDRIVPDLTLIGMATTLRRAIELEGEEGA